MTSSDEALDLADVPVRGATVGAALELELFWVLAGGARSAESLASALGMPAGRCEPLLELLATEGLVEEADGGWVLTAAARSSIVGGYSPATWQLLAEEARERLEAVRDLPAALRAEPAGPSGVSVGRPRFESGGGAATGRTLQRSRAIRACLDPDPQASRPCMAGAHGRKHDRASAGAGFATVTATPLPSILGVGGRSEAPTILEAR